MSLGKIVINTEKCKGCELCTTVCDKKSLKIAEDSNDAGYFPAETKEGYECSACAKCATMRPDACIEVFYDDSKS